MQPVFLNPLRPGVLLRPRGVQRRLISRRFRNDCGGRPRRPAVRAPRTFLRARNADNQPAVRALPGSRFRRLFMANHTRGRCIPFGTDDPPKENAQPDCCQGGNRAEKNDDSHICSGESRNNHYRARSTARAAALLSLSDVNGVMDIEHLMPKRKQDLSPPGRTSRRNSRASTGWDC